MEDYELAFASQIELCIPVNTHSDDPYWNLLAALLRDAIDAATGKPYLDKSARREAQKWLISKTDNWTLSCNLTCFFLKIDQDAMIKAVYSKFVDSQGKPQSQEKISRRKLMADDLQDIPHCLPPQATAA